jgi:3-oxoadipate enol-lactonase
MPVQSGSRLPGRVAGYRRARPGTQPEHLHPPYASSLKRAPGRPLVALPHTLSEVTGPLFGPEVAGASACDLTRQHAGEPLGERIVVSGRVLDEDGRPARGTLVEIWQANAAGRYLHDALGIERGHFCGLSIGGMIGMWLGAHAPGRVEKLVLCNTAARIGAAETWNARIEGVRAGGVRAIAAAVVERWFTPGFRARSPDVVASARRRLERAHPDGYVACCEGRVARRWRDADQRGELSAIRAPTLVIAGSEDPATPPAEARAVADLIAGARYLELPASHLSNLEAPAEFNRELTRFLTA